MDRRVCSERPGWQFTAITTSLATFAFTFAFVGVGASAAGAGNPPKWDKRVADLADFVERERGLDFKHPVPVRFLTERQFTKEYAADEGDLTAQDQRDLEQAAGLLRAVGLTQVDGKELFEDYTAVDTAGTEAFYDQEEQEIVVKGKDLGVTGRVIVVHELTHALQDQHFDLDKLDAKAGSSGAMAELALVEGDATRMEEEYLSTLSQQDQEEYGSEFEEQGAEAEGAVPADAPALLEIVDFAPYSLGPTFVEAIIAERGEEGVDDAFEKPPKSDKQILNPSAYLDGDNPGRVSAPKLGDGETKVGKPDTFGALALYLTLAGRVDIGVALSAIESWDGDSIVQFKRGDTACMRVAFTGEQTESTNRIADALDQWVARGPGGAASVTRADGVATLTACDPGTAPDEAKITSAGDVLDARAFLLYSTLVEGVPSTVAVCVADRMAIDPELIALYQNENPSEADVERLFRKAADAEAACPA